MYCGGYKTSWSFSLFEGNVNSFKEVFIKCVWKSKNTTWNRPIWCKVILRRILVRSVMDYASKSGIH